MAGFLFASMLAKLATNFHVCRCNLELSSLQEHLPFICLLSWTFLDKHQQRNMSARNKSKAKIQISKPELPPFLQRMKEQIVANEDNERREASERKRKSGGHRGTGNPEDEPTIVRIGDEDLTEEEYKRLKLELDSQYKLDNGKKADRIEELDIDSLIKSRTEIQPASSSRKDGKARKPSESGKPSDVKPPKSSKTAKTKQLSYGFPSDDDDDDDDDER